MYRIVSRAERLERKSRDSNPHERLRTPTVFETAAGRPTRLRLPGEPHSGVEPDMLSLGLTAEHPARRARISLQAHHRRSGRGSLEGYVGTAGLEPATPRSQSACATNCATFRWCPQRESNTRVRASDARARIHRWGQEPFQVRSTSKAPFVRRVWEIVKSVSSEYPYSRCYERTASSLHRIRPASTGGRMSLVQEVRSALVMRCPSSLHWVLSPCALLGVVLDGLEPSTRGVSIRCSTV